MAERDFTAECPKCNKRTRGRYEVGDECPNPTCEGTLEEYN